MIRLSTFVGSRFVSSS